MRDPSPPSRHAAANPTPQPPPQAPADHRVPRWSAGAKITGVDDKTYSSTGEAFSTVLLPNSESHTAKKLQADDVSLAYEVRFLPNLLLLSDYC